MVSMSAIPADSAGALRIVHVFRAPLGGLFRHVVDLAAEQAARGHHVGLFFDSGAAAGPRVESALQRIPGGLRLGVETAPIGRDPGVSDFVAFARFGRWLGAVNPDVVHGHGSKGGLLARGSRLATLAPAAARVYTPHGGSFNYLPGSASHRIYMGVERALAPFTDFFLFESAYIAGRFAAYAGGAPAFGRVIVNGLGPRDFDRVAPFPQASEFLYVGELRAAKGLDTLIEAFARLTTRSGAPPRLTLVGSGPEERRLTALAQAFGVADRIALPGPMPFREAARLGRILVVPSRMESLPYVVLEAAGGGVPMIATRVGGVPEIFGPFAGRLCRPDDPEDLSQRMGALLAEDASRRDAEAMAIRRYVADRFTIAAMTDGVCGAYREALSRRRRGARLAAPAPARGEVA